MATRRRNRKANTIASPLSGNQAAVIGGIFFIFSILASMSASEITIMIAVITAVAGGAGYIILRWKRHKRNEFNKLLGIATTKHGTPLVGLYLRSRRTDEFGNIDEQQWMGHVDRFLKMQVLDEQSDFEVWRRTSQVPRAAEYVNGAIAAKALRVNQGMNCLAKDPMDLTADGYEQFCGSLLEKAGWTVTQTQASRDGGADLVATKGDKRLIVQCKRYAKPVGNKAVQEINAAVRLYNGNIACVVAPSGFTQQAQREATGLSVQLLHHSQLSSYQ